MRTDSGGPPPPEVQALTGLCADSCAAVGALAEPPRGRRTAVPVTAVHGNRQILVDWEGKVVLVSGWRAFVKASSWEEFLLRVLP